MASKAQNKNGLLNPSTRKVQTDVRTRAVSLVVAVLVSAGLLYWQVQNITLIVAFLALVLSLTGVAFFLLPQDSAADQDHADPEDWAVTRMVADQSAIGLAITGGWGSPSKSWWWWSACPRSWSSGRSESPSMCY